MEKTLDSLCLCPIFRDLTRQQITEVLQKIPYIRRVFEKNEIIYREGDGACHIEVIISGSIEIRKYLMSGKRLSVFQRTRGEVLGGSIVFCSIPQYPCEVVARERCELLLFEKSVVLEILLKNTVIASNILRISADRIRQFEKRLELFSFYSIRKKIIFSLLHDFETGGEEAVYLPFSKTTWSEYLNVSRTSLSRELKYLCEQGMIEMNGNKIALLQKELMEELLW